MPGQEGQPPVPPVNWNSWPFLFSGHVDTVPSEGKTMHKNRVIPYLTVLACFLTTMSPPWPVQAGEVKKQIEAPVHKAVQIEQKTQAAQSQWRNEKEKKTQIFDELETQIKALEVEKARQMDEQQALTAGIERKKQELWDIEQISAQISPFLDQLLGRIQDFSRRDLPFLQEERTSRMSALISLSHDPKVPVSERFRKIMEALMVEAEYGQTIEVHQQTINLSGQDTLVNIFRLGRLNLFYQTLDKHYCGGYNTAKKDWEPLDIAHLKDIQAAIDMGSKRKPVELLDLPLGRIAVQ